ncbi:MAG: shikimate kinase, partial [Hyphomicrobium sp.]
MTETESVDAIKACLGQRSIVLVGLMGCGKSSIGKRLAARMGLPFLDADEEIERAAAKSINEIFTDHGEAHFREGERKVISRLLANGPQVLATGGGAYMHPETRQKIREGGFCIWLRAELPVLMRRVGKRDTRPLLRSGNPEATMRKLMEARYPVYAEADLTIESRDEPHEVIVSEIINRTVQRCAQVTSHSPNPKDAVAPMTAAPLSETVTEATATGTASRTVGVDLANRSYDVLIGTGLVRNAGALIKQRLGPVKCGIVTDENVARHHLAVLEASLKAEGMFAGSIILPPGEA